MNLGTYHRHDGREVEIRGLAKCEPIEGQRVYWSLQGDWFAEDGRAVGLHQLPSHKGSWITDTRVERILYAADAACSLNIKAPV